ncbi:MAG: tripartite tricarboxylate transporter substrate binding protein [Betaproteobacteria bacterium]|nr:tripartite tricarboxylate transporter substrate binding protein [Betaproteobacteria bacterium]
MKGKNRRPVFTVYQRGVDTIFIEEESMVDRKILSVVPFLCALAWAPYAAAQVEYPTRPIRLIMPAAPGGGGDFTARLVGQKLGESLGQVVIVDNRPGADGIIGARIVAMATPDGHTLLMSITSFPINPTLHPKIPFDTVKDFAPIVLLASAPLLLVVNPSLEVKSVSDLMALAKSKPGQLNYASGIGNTAHLAAELFKKMAGVSIVGVRYKGGGPAIIDLIGGRVQLYFSTIPASLAHIQAGRLRGIAVTTTKRVSLMPHVPTVAESGLPGFEVIGWFALYAPAATPTPIIAKLHKEVSAVLRMPETQQRFATQGLVPGGGAPEELDSLLRSEIVKWGTLIKELGITSN